MSLNQFPHSKNGSAHSRFSRSHKEWGWTAEVEKCTFSSQSSFSRLSAGKQTRTRIVHNGQTLTLSFFSETWRKPLPDFDLGATINCQEKTKKKRVGIHFALKVRKLFLLLLLLIMFLFPPPTHSVYYWKYLPWHFRLTSSFPPSVEEIRTERKTGWKLYFLAVRVLEVKNWTIFIMFWCITPRTDLDTDVHLLQLCSLFKKVTNNSRAYPQNYNLQFIMQTQCFSEGRCFPALSVDKRKAKFNLSRSFIFFYSKWLDAQSHFFATIVSSIRKFV